VSSCEIRSSFGHDSFLIENDMQTKLIRSFLKKTAEEGGIL
jgi:homoserine acetyltransferase